MRVLTPRYKSGSSWELVAKHLPALQLWPHLSPFTGSPCCFLRAAIPPSLFLSNTQHVGTGTLGSLERAWFWSWNPNSSSTGCFLFPRDAVPMIVLLCALAYTRSSGIFLWIFWICPILKHYLFPEVFCPLLPCPILSPTLLHMGLPMAPLSHAVGRWLLALSRPLRCHFFQKQGRIPLTCPECLSYGCYTRVFLIFCSCNPHGTDIFKDRETEVK